MVPGHGPGAPVGVPVGRSLCRADGRRGLRDLRFGDRLYDEWREVPASDARQEVGNATYPACNAPEGCPGSEFDGFGATDVWLVVGVDVEDAVIGLREGSDTYVVFVRRGVDPASLPMPTG